MLLRSTVITLSDPVVLWSTVMALSNPVFLRSTVMAMLWWHCYGVVIYSDGIFQPCVFYGQYIFQPCVILMALCNSVVLWSTVMTLCNCDVVVYNDGIVFLWCCGLQWWHCLTTVMALSKSVVLWSTVVSLSNSVVLWSAVMALSNSVVLWSAVMALPNSVVLWSTVMALSNSVVLWLSGVLAWSWSGCVLCQTQLSICDHCWPGSAPAVEINCGPLISSWRGLIHVAHTVLTGWKACLLINHEIQLLAEWSASSALAKVWNAP